jgi:hypothetical protein
MDNQENSNVSVDKKAVSFNDDIEVKEISAIINEDINSSLDNNEDSNNNRCSNCRKIFRTVNAFNNHKRTQICYSSKNKTYCTTCDKSFNSREELDNHLLSMDHYECINNLSSTTPLKRNNKLYSLDPILNNKEVDQMNTVDIGSNITFIYKNDDISKHEIKINNSNIINSNIGITSSNSNSSINIVNSDNVENNEERKKKIIDFLINNANTKECSKNFLKLLNKLSIEDYDGLNNAIVKNNEIPVLSKQQYIKTIQTFINLLIKKKTKGESKHNGYDIQDIVTAISK